MNMHSDSKDGWENLREKIIGLGEGSIRKSYYPELQEKLTELKRFRALLDKSNDAIFFIELPAGRIVDVNETACHLFGHSQEELVNMYVYDIVKPETAVKIKGVFYGGIIDEDSREIITTTIHKKNGEEVPVEATVNYSKFGDTLYAVAVFRDITERKKIEDALKESEKLYSTLVEKGSDGILIVYNGLVKFANKKIEEICGYTVDEVLNTSFIDYISSHYREAVLKRYKNRMAGGKVLNRFEISISTKDGRDVPIDVTASKIEYRGKSAAMYIIRDISKRKKMEMEMRKRLMKFSIDEGEIYLVKESTLTVSTEAFNDLLNAGYGGLVISRTPEKEIRKLVEQGDFEFLWLSEIGENALAPDLKKIGQIIENMSRNKVVLIDRLEYLFFKNGFNETLSFVHSLKEMAYVMGYIIILSIDPVTVSQKELRHLEKETREIEPSFKGGITEKLLAILRFVYSQNTTGVKPSYTDIGNELKLSKPTARKKIRKLVYAGYLVEVASGRTKVVELTEKGRNSFWE